MYDDYEFEMMGDDEDYMEDDYEDFMMGRGRRRPRPKRRGRRRRGSRQQIISRRKRHLKTLRADARDRAAQNRELIASRQAGNMWTDEVTGETFKVFPIVLTESDFTVSANTASTETTIGSYTVPNGIELLFRAVKTGVAGAYLDRSAPYLHGSLKTSSNVAVTGTVRIKVMDASENDLKGQPFTGSSTELNDASSIDWNQRLFFNCIKPVRSKSGDRVLITLNSSSVIDTSSTYTNWTLHLLQLSKQ